MSFPRYKAYRESGVEWLGPIPDHWKTLELRRIARLQSGEAITADAIEESGPYPVFGGGGLRGYTNAFTHDGEFALIGRQGALCGNINYGSGRFWASEHSVVVHPRCQLDTRWLGETLRSMNLNQYSLSAAQPGLSVDLVGRLRVPLPPFGEQESISKFLVRETAKIDALIAEQQRLLERLQEKRQAAITHAVTKGLNPAAPMKPSGNDWLGDVPAHWDVQRIKWVAEMQSGHTPDKKVPGYWDDGDIPWVSLNDTGYLRDHTYISSTSLCITQLGIEHSSARLLPARVVVFSRDATIGRCAITTKPMTVSQHFIAWVCGPRLLPEYLLLRLRTMTQELERLTAGATVKTIGMPDVSTLVTPVPPLPEQQEIVTAIADIAANLDALCEDARQATDLLEEKRRALISAAVTGQIDVRCNSLSTAA